MNKHKRKDLFNALSDLKVELKFCQSDLSDKQKKIINRNIKSIEKQIDTAFFL